MRILRYDVFFTSKAPGHLQSRKEVLRYKTNNFISLTRQTEESCGMKDWSQSGSTSGTRCYVSLFARRDVPIYRRHRR